jgi:hypothetical protein
VYVRERGRSKTQMHAEGEEENGRKEGNGKRES